MQKTARSSYDPFCLTNIIVFYKPGFIPRFFPNHPFFAGGKTPKTPRRLNLPFSPGQPSNALIACLQDKGILNVFTDLPVKVVIRISRIRPRAPL